MICSNRAKMNSIIYLCIISCVAVNGYVNPFLPITALRNRVNSATSDLTRYSNNVEFQLRTKLSNLKINQMQNVNNAVNPALTDTRNAIEAAKKEGKNAEHCYELTRQELATVSKSAFSALDKCVSDQLSTLAPVQQNIQTHLSNGRILLSDLDSITISCASGNAMQAQICVAQHLPNASNLVQNYEQTAKQLQNTGNTVSNSAELATIRCFQSPMSSMYQSVASARSSANSCIKNS